MRGPRSSLHFCNNWVRYEDVLGADDVSSLIALTSFHAGYRHRTSNRLKPKTEIKNDESGITSRRRMRSSSWRRMNRSMPVAGAAASVAFTTGIFFCFFMLDRAAASEAAIAIFNAVRHPLPPLFFCNITLRCGPWTPRARCPAAAYGTAASRSRARAVTKMCSGRGCRRVPTAAASATSPAELNAVFRLFFVIFVR